MNHTKRAQTEILGLVFIVILVTLAMMFYLGNTAKRVQEDSNKNVQVEYAFNEQATSFIDVLVDTDVCGVTFKDLIIDCATTGRIRCADGRNSCEQVNHTAYLIVSQTLEVWQQPFLLNISLSPERYYQYGLDAQGNLIQEGEFLCSGSTVGRGAPGIFPIPYFPYSGQAYIELGICR